MNDTIGVLVFFLAIREVCSCPSNQTGSRGPSIKSIHN